jgi:hypothetical protein
MFERIAARTIGIDQDYIWLQPLHFSRQIFRASQNGRYLITGERQPGTNFASAGTRFIDY